MQYFYPIFYTSRYSIFCSFFYLFVFCYNLCCSYCLLFSISSRIQLIHSDSPRPSIYPDDSAGVAAGSSHLLCSSDAVMLLLGETQDLQCTPDNSLRIFTGNIVFNQRPIKRNLLTLYNDCESCTKASKRRVNGKITVRNKVPSKYISSRPTWMLMTQSYRRVETVFFIVCCASPI